MRVAMWFVIAGVPLVIGCGGKKSGQPTIEAEWKYDKDAEFDCKPPILTITDPSGQRELSADQITGNTVTVEHNGKTHEVAVPARKPPDIELSFQRNRPSPEAWWGTLILTVAAKEDRTSWAGGANEAGELVLPLPCGVTSGSAPGGRVVTDGFVPRLIVDAGDRMLATEAVAFDVTVSVTGGPSGREAKIRFEGKLEPKLLLAARLRSAAERPLTSAPVFTAGARQPAALVIENATEIVGKGSLADAAIVAIATSKREFAPECGPYGGTTMLQRFRTDATVIAVEARTGKRLGEQAFQGAVPDCPKSALVATMDGTSTAVDTVTGSPPLAKIRAWIAKLAK